MADKKSFVMYESWGASIEKMSKEQAGELLKAIYAYQKDPTAAPEDPALVFVFEIIKQKLEEDSKRYNEVCTSRAEAGRKGGEAKASNTKQNAKGADNEKQTVANVANVANASKSYQTVANVADNDTDTEYDTESDSEYDTESVSDAESEKEKETEVVAYAPTSCTERFGNPSMPEPEEVTDEDIPAPVEAIALNDGSEWQCCIADYNEYVRLYPGVDVQQEFRKMRGWAESNPERRKTKRGIKRFVVSWLNRAQDRGVSARSRPGYSQQPSVAEQLRSSIDAMNDW